MEPHLLWGGSRIEPCQENDSTERTCDSEQFGGWDGVGIPKVYHKIEQIRRVRQLLRWHQGGGDPAAIPTCPGEGIPEGRQSFGILHQHLDPQGRRFGQPDGYSRITADDQGITCHVFRGTGQCRTHDTFCLCVEFHRRPITGNHSGRLPLFCAWDKAPNPAIDGTGKQLLTRNSQTPDTRTGLRLPEDASV